MEQERITIGQDLKLVEGMSFSIHCPASGIPKPLITWYFNDVVVQNSPKYEILSKFNRLVVDQIETKDTGQYMCVAENAVGSESESSFISILGKLNKKY